MTHDRNTAPDPARAFRKAFRKLCAGGHYEWPIFADFAELSAIALANAIVGSHAREKRFEDVANRYTIAEWRWLREMRIQTSAGVSYERDFLGELFMALEPSSHWKGQFFTPMAVCQIMTGFMGTAEAPSTRERIARGGFLRVLEPACGAGAMVLAPAGAMKEGGLNMHVTAADVDPTAAHMCFIQLSLVGIPGVVRVGNTLSGETRDALATPAHYTGLWSLRLLDDESGGEPEPREDES